MTMFGNAIGLSPGNLGMKLFKPSAAPALWWDPNNEGLPVVGAYRAIATVGSPWPLAPANYAESLQDWSGTSPNLIEGNGAVPWAGPTGWGFVAAALQWLDVGTGPGPQGAPAQSWSALIQYANFGSNGDLDIMQTRNNNTSGFGFKPNRFGSVRYLHGSNLLIAPSLLAGNLGVAGATAYRNGVAEAGVFALWPYFGNNVFIGAANNLGVGIKFVDADVYAVALYSSVLTAPQVLAVATAMGQL